MSRLIKLTVKIGDKEIDLEKEEARELYNALSEVFGVKTPITFVPPYANWIWPLHQPYWTFTSAVGGVVEGSSRAFSLSAKLEP